MARKPAAKSAPNPPTHSPAYALALRLHAALELDPSLQLDTAAEQPGGVVEANALFDLRDAEGRAFRVRVIRTH
ncbi:MAG: hypothetical protein JNK30_18315 [Phenylobacterium sp.]|uniref:hypothetical protein n=1 Tax=Phenylobacterium sp. TaxID=1871053 RepID=UPI001A395D3D|nr:hypothetical protein [Phenylobacterium sp.]MBL8773344.1 hypothetical protein [Phenylobacterium sp.]